MASVQHVRASKQLSDKEKAAIEEAVKGVQASIEKKKENNAKANQERQLVLVQGYVQNLQPRVVKLEKTHEWNGKFLVNPPERLGGLGPNDSGTFEHEGATSQGNLPVLVGSKGAFIYGHFDFALPNLGWLVAWDKPDNSNGPNKVYVDAGELSRLMRVDWSEIEKNLDASESYSRYFDSATNAIVAAEIKDTGDKLASLASSFHIYVPPPQV
ncbi:hypothetical protein BVRB_4g074190 [Beta vulgaris subsp. vulgaris]|nr:hypothetical protein BVRB_4g074190 [Beta vulgaris subsp. vulgaris]